MATDVPLARLKRRLLALVVVLVASLTIPYLLAASRATESGRWLGLGLGAGLAGFGAAWLVIRYAILPELGALARARSGPGPAPLATEETNDYLRDVSQEIRASMHAVLGLTQLLLRSPLDGTQHRQLRTIDGAARALLRIINDLLTLSGPGRGRFDFVSMGSSLHDLLRVSADLVEPAAKDKGLTLELRLALDLPDRVLIDSGRVQQIVLGACRHAIDECEQGPLRIDASARNPGEGRFDFVLRVAGPTSASALPESAEPAAAGTLPGAASPSLSFARRLIALMGGNLSASKGSVEVVIPLSRIDGATTSDARARRAAAADKLAIRLPAASSPILVVDGDPLAQVAAIELLENLGFEAEAAGDAERAAERVAKKKYSLILMATDLPGQDGYAAAQRIQAVLGPQRPAIIGCTREVLAVARGRAALNMEDMLAKPLDRRALCDVLAEWLPDEINPASSGTRLSQIGALMQATRRALGGKPPPGPSSPGQRLPSPSSPDASSPDASLPDASLPDLAPGLRADRLVELFALQAPAEVRALARAVGRDGRDEVVELARRLKERCDNCGASKMAALCARLEGARELSPERLAAHVDELRQALAAVLDLLGEQPISAESTPASATTDRTPDSP